MSYYAGTSYTDEQISSLVVSQANLLQGIGVAVDPPTLADCYTELGLSPTADGLAAPEETVILAAHGESGSLPTTSHSLIRFASPDPGSDPDGFYCAVDDISAQTVIDSRNGQVKPIGFFGQPLGWYSYELALPPTLPVDPATPKDKIYTVLKHETLFTVARKTGFPESELALHNGLKDYTIHTGQVLHLPEALPATAKAETRIEVLDAPKLVHLLHPAGKWMFSQHTSPKDITQNSGAYPLGYEFKVAALAYVPVIVDGQPEEWGYYLDALALGDYPTTGRVKYNMGFKWTDCEEGAYVPPLQPVVEAAQTVETPEAVADTTPAVDDSWKASYEPLEAGPTKYVIITECECPDLDNLDNPSAYATVGQKFIIAGTFVVDDRIYYRRAVDVDRGSWRGIPFKSADVYTETTYDDALFNAPIPKADARDALPRYPWEKYLVAPLGTYAGKAYKTVQKIKEKR